MKPDRLPVLPGPPELNEIKDLECQPGVTAHTDSKGQSGEVSTLAPFAWPAFGVLAMWALIGMCWLFIHVAETHPKTAIVFALSAFGAFVGWVAREL